MSQSKRRKKRKFKDPHHAREKARYGSPIVSREFILKLLREEKAPMDFDALSERLDMKSDPEAREALRRRIGAMQRDGQLIENRKRGIIPVDDQALVAGRISAHPDGYGFLVADDNDGHGDIYLSGKQMRQVLHGDKAIACITGTDRRGRREGRIIDVVERANKSVVGRFTEEKGALFVAPDNKRLHLDLVIAAGERGKAVHGDIVVAEITEQPTRKHPPVGKVVEVLGKHMEPGMEIDMALRSHDIPFEWPQTVLDQAATFSTTVQPQDKIGRKDICRLPLVTIDGIDARDFDDAVYCEASSSGWRLIVAIADVAHYVQPESELDIEAQSRGTSVYFPGRVVPMLPEVLSNGLCSINPDVERLCMLCEMTLDHNGSIKRSRFYNAVMRSHARLTYSQVNEILSDDGSELHSTYSELIPHLRNLHDLYLVLKVARQKRGAIEIESSETRIVFDENKKIREIVPVVRNDAHKLIEECMILANVATAAFLEQHTVPAQFRVHHGPKADRLEDLRAFLSVRGLTLSGGDKPSALDYAALSKQIADRPDRSVISTVMLRSMQQAVYQPRNDGHFGLALSQYAHFTSPIRRYPDLLVHRALKHILKRESSITYNYSKEQMVVLAENCSMTERRADEATRDVVSWLKCEYMQEHIGSEYSGVVTSVTSFGLFIELTGIHVEGLLHVTSLSRDYYRFDQAHQAMIGERTGKQYRLGEEIRVRVEAVNLEDRKIDFSEVESGKKTGKKKSEKKKSGKQQHSVWKKKKPESGSADAQVAESGKAGRKKAAEKKTTAKKTTAKKVTAKKATAKKATAKKATAKKATAKKATAKKTTAKKTTAKKTTAKKTTAKKTTAKKTTAKKTTAKKTTAKKTTAKKTAKKKRTKKSSSRKG